MSDRFTVRLKSIRDEDLINWLQNLGEGERSCFIRNTLRGAIQSIDSSFKLSFKNTSSNTERLPIKPQETNIDTQDDSPHVSDESIENKVDELMNGF